LRKTKVKEVMSKKVIKIYVDEKVSHALELFVQYRVYYLPVVNRKNHLVGMLTHKYLYKTQSPRRIMNEDVDYNPDFVYDGQSFYSKETLDSYTLSNIMYQEPFTLGPQDSAADAVISMYRKNIGCIPIVRPDRRVCGILTSQDLVHVAARILLDEF